MRINKTGGALDLTYLLTVPYFAVVLTPWFGRLIRFRYVIVLCLAWIILTRYSSKRLHLPLTAQKWFWLTVFYYSLYALLQVIYMPFGRSVGVTYLDVFDVFRVLFPLVLFHISVINGKFHEMRYILGLCFICLLIMCYMTIRGEVEIEGASRAITGGGSDYASMDIQYDAFEASNMGVGAFGNIYGMALLLFPMAYCLRFMSIKQKWCAMTLFVVGLAAVYRAGFMLSVIGICVAGILYFGKRTNMYTVRPVGVLLVFMTLIILAQPGILKLALSPLERLSQRTFKEEYRYRIESITSTITGDENAYAAYRSSLNWRSWDAFKRSPLVGIGPNNVGNPHQNDIGGHSQLFDLLGCYGLLGAGLFTLFLYYLYRYMKEMSRCVLGISWWPAYQIFMFSACVVAILNPLKGAVIYINVFLLLPAMALLNRNHDIRTNQA